MSKESKTEKSFIFSERFKKLVAGSNKTMTQISKETGINIATLYRYKNGEIYPNLDTLYLLSSYFKVDIAYLTGLSDNDNLIKYDVIVPDYMIDLFDRLVFIGKDKYKEIEAIINAILDFREKT